MAVSGQRVYAAGDAVAPGRFGPVATAGPVGSTSAVLAYLPDATLAPLATRPATLGLGWQVFPNPAAGAATLTGAAPGTRVEVRDAVGRSVGAATVGADGTVELRLPAGLYLVRMGPQVTRLEMR